MQNIVIHDSFYVNHKPQKVNLIKNVIIIMLSLISYESQKEQSVVEYCLLTIIKNEKYFLTSFGR